MKLPGQIKKLFVLTKSEQRGVAILLLLLLIIIIVNLLLPHFVRHKRYKYEDFEEEINRFVAAEKKLEDSIKTELMQNSGTIDYELAKRKLKPFTFDPNRLPEELWLKMGLTRKQVRTIKNYEAKGGKFRTKEDLKKIYAISAVEYSILEPYIKIKSGFVSENEKHFKTGTKNRSLSKIQPQLKKTEINGSDSVKLINDLNLPPWIAARIIKYRKLLGGFYDKNQLKEVYGLKEDTYKKIEKYIIVDTAKIVKIDINNATFKTIIRHPYIDYQAAKKIVEGRKRRYGYKNLEEVKNDLKVSKNIFNKIAHYLYIRPQKSY